jgi:hypothetical protein
LELEYDVAQLDRNFTYTSGVLLGNIWEDAGQRAGVYFYIAPKNNAHGILAPTANINQYRSDTQHADHVRIQAWDGACLYYLNDLEFPVHPMAGLTLANRIDLADVRSVGPIGRARFSNLRVRKLSLPPPPMERDEDRIGYFDGLIAEHPQDGFLYYQRGLCRASHKQWADAEADLKKAASLADDIPQAHLALNEVERSLGKFAEAVEEVDRYLKIKPDDVKARNYQAWTLATCRDEKVRSGKQAIVHAQKACELTNYEDANILDTLAAAYAESGDFDQAVKWQTKAADLTWEQMKPEFKSKIELYKSKKPYREQ